MPQWHQAKFASNARQTSLRFRSGSSISPTVRLKPTASMLETTKTRIVIGIILLTNSTGAFGGECRLWRLAGFRLDRSPGCARSLQAVGATEQGREDCRVGQQDVAGAVACGGIQRQELNSRVARGRERMRPLEVDRLPARTWIDSPFSVGHRVVRQVGMEIEGRHALEQAEPIEVAC